VSQPLDRQRRGHDLVYFPVRAAETKYLLAHIVIPMLLPQMSHYALDPIVKQMQSSKFGMVCRRCLFNVSRPMVVVAIGCCAAVELPAATASLVRDFQGQEIGFESDGRHHAK